MLEPIFIAAVICIGLFVAYAGRPSRSRRNRAETSTGLLASPCQQDHQGIMLYSLILIGLAITFHFAEWQVYIGSSIAADRFFAGQNQYYFMIAMIGFGVAAAVQIRGFIAPPWVFEIPKFAGKSTFASNLVFNRQALVKQLFIGLLLVVAVQLVFGALLQPFFGTISKLEKSVFYFVGAISEELFYRFLIQNTGAGLLRKIPVKIFRNNAFIPGMISMVPTAIFFMSQHGTAYADKPILFVGTFFLGVAFGTIYVISQNIFLPMLLHAVSNLLVSFRDIWGVGALTLNGNDALGIAYIIIAGTIIAGAIMIGVNNKKQPKQDETATGKMGQIPISKKSHKTAWIIIIIMTAFLLVVSLLLDAWRLM